MTPQIYIAIANVRNILKKHHAFMFVVFIGLLLVFAVFSLYQVLSTSLVDSASANSTIDEFDQKTVDKIKNLHDSSDQTESSLVFPQPRPNPFDE